MQVKISLPPELVETLDRERGDVSRSVFYQRRLEGASSVPGERVARLASEAVQRGEDLEEALTPKKSTASAPRKSTAAPKSVEPAPESRAEMFARATQKGKR